MDVRHNAAQQRYEVALDGQLAVLDYEFVDGRQVFTHTFVPPELRGRGLAELLVRAGLDEAKSANRRVVPACSYVEAFIRRHTDYRSLLGQ